MDQAQTEKDGRPYFRWYVYATDGHRKVTWAHTADEALDKARRSTSQAMSDRVDPAPH